MANPFANPNDAYVLVNTNYGAMTFEIYSSQAPITANNFLSYVNSGFYSNTVFHRVVNNFVVQGGGFDTSYTQKATQPPITLESQTGLSNTRGSVAMARTNAADSATSQFFVNTVDNLFLDYQSATSPGYAVFGTVYKGLDVVDRVNKASVYSGTTFPVTDVVLLSAKGIAASQALAPDASKTATPVASQSSMGGVGYATFNGNRADFSSYAGADGLIHVSQLTGAYSETTLGSSTSRVLFTDYGVAYDASGTMGEAARMLLTAFGYEALYIRGAVGAGLSLYDAGLSREQVADILVKLPLYTQLTGGSNTGFVNLLVSNLTGSPASADTLAALVPLLDNQVLTQGQLLAKAAGLPIAAAQADLVGLATAGIEFVL